MTGPRPRKARPRERVIDLRRIFGRLSLVILGLAVALAAVELAFRIFPPAPPSYTGYEALGDDCVAPHLTLGHAPVPDRCGRDERGLLTW